MSNKIARCLHCDGMRPPCDLCPDPVGHEAWFKWWCSDPATRGTCPDPHWLHQLRPLEAPTDPDALALRAIREALETAKGPLHNAGCQLSFLRSIIRRLEPGNVAHFKGEASDIVNRISDALIELNRICYDPAAILARAKEGM